MSSNLTSSVSQWYEDNWVKKENLFWWNYVMGYAGQPQCNVSVIAGTTTPVAQCSDYAWLIRALVLIIGSSAIIGAILVGCIGYILYKSDMETSGKYKEELEKIAEQNAADGTKWTFP